MIVISFFGSLAHRILSWWFVLIFLCIHLIFFDGCHQKLQVQLLHSVYCLSPSSHVFNFTFNQPSPSLLPFRTQFLKHHPILNNPIILYYIILYYTILYYTILYYTILYYTILYYTILYYTILYYTILYFRLYSSHSLCHSHLDRRKRRMAQTQDQRDAVKARTTFGASVYCTH